MKEQVSGTTLVVVDTPVTVDTLVFVEEERSLPSRRKRIYGLKKATRVWNIKFNEFIIYLDPLD